MHPNGVLYALSWWTAPSSVLSGRFCCSEFIWSPNRLWSNRFGGFQSGWVRSTIANWSVRDGGTVLANLLPSLLPTDTLCFDQAHNMRAIVIGWHRTLSALLNCNGEQYGTKRVFALTTDCYHWPNGNLMNSILLDWTIDSLYLIKPDSLKASLFLSIRESLSL